MTGETQRVLHGICTCVVSHLADQGTVRNTIIPYTIILLTSISMTVNIYKPLPGCQIKAAPDNIHMDIFSLQRKSYSQHIDCQTDVMHYRRQQAHSIGTDPFCALYNLKLWSDAPTKRLFASVPHLPLKAPCTGQDSAFGIRRNEQGSQQVIRLQMPAQGRTFLGRSGKLLTTSQSCFTPCTCTAEPPTAR